MITIDPAAERQRIQTAYHRLEQELTQIEQARAECIAQLNALTAEDAFIGRLEAQAATEQQAEQTTGTTNA